MKKQKKQKKPKKQKIINTIYIISITISLILLFLINYIKIKFKSITIEQLLYSLYTAGGTSDTVIIEGIIYILPKTLLIVGLICFTVFITHKYIKINQYLIIKIKNKTFKMHLFPLSNMQKTTLTILLFIITIYYGITSFGILNYLNPNYKSNFIEKNYINAKKVKITTPEEKQNLIYIYVESLETSFLSNEKGGNFKETVTPNLEKIASENINFSANETIGGAYVLEGSHYTVAGMVSSTAGIPLKFPFGENKYSGYGEFLPGAYTLGDILKENGYKNYLFIGSDANFAGRKDYFVNHGDYEILDYNYAKKQKLIDEDYHVWWGYEDKKLYQFAKDELSKIASQEEPFNFTLLTTDTHFIDGYLEKTCENPYDIQYLNSYNCTDNMLGEFINWIKKQDFYENTTIVITGDHLSMQENLSEMFDNQKYERTVYNAYINPVINTKNTKNRKFTTLDFYPTTLAALGFKIEGEKLGLGTNLFSNKKTLLEKNSFNKINEEISKTSEFYNKNILEK